MPNKICHPCKFQLEKSYVFRKKCENSDTKLRQHIKSLQEKIGDVDLTKIEDNEVPIEEESRYEGEAEVAREEPSTEEDLVGVTQVAYLQPDQEPDDDPENITLPAEEELVNKDACTLKTMKKERVEIEGMDTGDVDENDDEDEECDEEQIFMDDTGHEMEDTSYDAIADAVKATLAQQPGKILH